MDVSVRMGELEVSRDGDDVLVTHGLGSCIGVAVVDHGCGVAGLAHVMLPGPGDPAARPPGTFADSGVPALLDEVQRLGARLTRLRVAIVGGAKMFGAAGGSRMNMGERNEAAVRAALQAAGVRVDAAQTGGSTGRTIRVVVGEGRICARTASGTDEDLVRPLFQTRVAA